MKKTLIIFCIGLALSIIVPVLVSNAPLFFNFAQMDVDEKLSTLRTYIDYYMGIVIFTLTIVFTYITYYISEIQTDRAKVVESQNRLDNNINHLASLLRSSGQDAFYTVDKTGLYNGMLAFVKDAKIRIDLMYLNDVPPSQLDPCPERDQFYSGLNDVIYAGSIPVKRVVLLTEDNKQWIKQYARKHNNKKNFSLYIVKDKPMPPVSIQIIDNRFVILISIFRHALSGVKKHLIFESPNLALVFQSHYSAVLDKSIAIVENGRVVESNLRQYLS
jgi:hypothetical protein